MKTSFSLLALLAAVAVAKPTHRARSVGKVHKRQYDGNNTSNQLLDGTPCRDITVIFARGTFEGGNIGAVVGPFLAQQLVNDTSVDQVAVQGVDYPADVNGFLAGGDANGSALMASLAEQAAYQCPDTNLVLSGYSQGAQLVHNAAANLSECTTDFISSIVVFGNPDEGKPFGNVPDSKVLDICHETDSICHGGYSITAAHLNYSNDVPEAAQFIVDHAILP